jgi:hypothetical protein
LGKTEKSIHPGKRITGLWYSNHTHNKVPLPYLKHSTPNINERTDWNTFPAFQTEYSTQHEIGLWPDGSTGCCVRSFQAITKKTPGKERTMVIRIGW